MKEAVCLLARETITDEARKAPRYLAVTRRNDETKGGFPGGKVDPGETSLQAVIRETGEEVGMPLDPSKLKLVYSGVCPGKGPDDTYLVHTYETTQPWSLSDLVVEEGLTALNVTEEDLCSTAWSPFASYNKEVFEALKHR